MDWAETVTFGGAGGTPVLDRAALWRGDAQKQAQMEKTGLFTPIWRGRVAVQDGAAQWLPRHHPVFDAAGAVIFLGLVDGVARFCVDISRWTPDVEPMQPTFFDTSLQSHPDLPATGGFADLRLVMTALTALDAECLAVAKGLLHWHDSHGFCAACGAASQISHAGWQRHCPACARSHFPRTDPVVIMLVVHQDKLLLGRSPQWPEGMYSLLAGFIEPGEVIEAAVRREVWEESGIRVGAVRYLASQPWVFPASLMIGCIATAESVDITLDPVELQDARWISRADLVLVQNGSHPVIKPGRKGAIAQFLIEAWLQDRIG